MPSASVASRKRTAREERDISPPPKRRKEKPEKSQLTDSKSTEPVAATTKNKTGKVKSKEVTKVVAVKVEKKAIVSSKSQSKAVKVEGEIVKAEVHEAGPVKVVKAKPKRKTKEEKAAEAMPLATRTIGAGLRIIAGAHVSAAGGKRLICHC